MKRPVLYPYARVDGVAVHVDSWVRGRTPSCFGCQAAMVARFGTRQHHFAHKAAHACSEESALHWCGKVLAVAGHAAAVQQGRPYWLRWQCPACGDSRQADLARHALAVRDEVSVVPRVRSDLVFEGARRSCAVEVVVTHDVEDATWRRYASAELPVFTFHPTWETVASLGAGIAAARAVNVDTTHCPGCIVVRARREEAKAVEARRRAKSEAQLSRLRPWLKTLPGSRTPLVPWTRDQEGNTLYLRITHKLWAQGQALLDLGFQQAQEKPWLFFLRVPGAGMVYASMGGGLTPIWEDARARMWGRGEHEVIEEVRLHARRRGVRFLVT